MGTFARSTKEQIIWFYSLCAFGIQNLNEKNGVCLCCNPEYIDCRQSLELNTKINLREKRVILSVKKKLPAMHHSNVYQTYTNVFFSFIKKKMKASHLKRFLTQFWSVLCTDFSFHFGIFYHLIFSLMTMVVPAPRGSCHHQQLTRSATRSACQNKME